MKTQDFFARHPVFRHEEFVDFMEKKQSRNVRTRDSLLAGYIKRGRIIRVKRGLYITVPPGFAPESCPVDPYLVAAKMTDDAVLAYHTALEFHGRAYSVYQQLVYLTKLSPRPVNFRGQSYKGVPFPKVLRNKNQESFEVKILDRAGLDVRLTSLERTLVDVLDRPSLSGTWEELWRSLESVEFFDLDRVIEYAILLGNSTTVAKVGFYLEQHKQDYMVDNGHLNRLREYRPRKPHYMVLKKRKQGHLAPGWNLVVPWEVLNRSWEQRT